MRVIYNSLCLFACFLLLSAASPANESTNGEFDQFMSTYFLKTWRYEMLKVNGKGGTGSELDACQRDLRVSFSSNNTFNEKYSEKTCPKSFTGKWEYNKEAGEITTIKPDGSKTVAKILSATPERFEVQIMSEPEAEIILTLVRADVKRK